MTDNAPGPLDLDRSVSPLMRLGHLIRTTALYGIAGPPMGAGWLYVSGLLDASESRVGSPSLLDHLLGWLVYAMFSYIRGFFPALLAGFLLGLLPRQIPLVVLLPLAGSVGVVATSIFHPVDLPAFGGLAAMTVAAAAAGLSWLSARLGRVEGAVD